eukprot:TRINITY_DN83158_c0_g1_i1.p1 TRINITY_DN83158_c0_g1~~TRINITY_DN83158_c0_g1_i1.p1  ORF type:complete len:608 (-),score=162.89 TRINITY_DN83158_c0_g1_i1:145-1968(-)
MGNDSSICVERDKDDEFDTPNALGNGKTLPPLVLLIDSYVAASGKALDAGGGTAGGASSSNAGGNPPLVLTVRLDGHPVKGAELTTIPTQPIKLPTAASSARLKLSFFSAAPPGSSSGAATGQRVCADISVPMARLAAFGAPLFTSLWLGLDETLEARTEGSVRLEEAIQKARMPGAPKVKVTLFRPAHGESRGNMLTNGPASSSRSSVKQLGNVEPDVKSLFTHRSDEADEHNTVEAKIAQIRGVIRCLAESNEVILAQEQESEKQAAIAQDVQGFLEALTSRRKAHQQQVLSFQELLRLKSSQPRPLSSKDAAGGSATKGATSTGSLRYAGASQMPQSSPNLSSPASPSGTITTPRRSLLRSKTEHLRKDLDDVHDVVRQHREAIGTLRRAKTGDLTSSSSPLAVDEGGLKAEVDRLTQKMSDERQAHEEETRSLREELRRRCEEVTRLRVELELFKEGGTGAEYALASRTRDEMEPEPEQAGNAVKSSARNLANKIARLGENVKFGGKKSSADQGGAHGASPASSKHDAASELHWLKELEKLELSLFEERQRSAALLEEKLATEAAHQRDVMALERMLEEVMNENDWALAKVGALQARSSVLQR